MQIDKQVTKSHSSFVAKVSGNKINSGKTSKQKTTLYDRPAGLQLVLQAQRTRLNSQNSRGSLAVIGFSRQTYKQSGLIHAQFTEDLMQTTKLEDYDLQEIMQIVKSVAQDPFSLQTYPISLCILMILMIKGVECGDRRIILNIFVDVGKHFCSRVNGVISEMKH